MAAHAPPIGVAELLREWRERRRVSQLELALRAGTTQRHISFIERERSLPRRGMIVRLAEALEVPLRDRNELLLAAGYAPRTHRRASTIRRSTRSEALSSESSKVTSPTRP